MIGVIRKEKGMSNSSRKRTSQPAHVGLTEEERALIRQVAAQHGAYEVRLFGSLARGEASSESDIDLLVAKGPDTSPWFPAGLILELEEQLGRKVDVVTEKGLSPYLREQILQEAIPL
jgi:uncharacterized protein